MGKWEQIEAQSFEFHDYAYSDPQWLESVVKGLEAKGKQVKKLRVRSDTHGLRMYAVFTKGNSDDNGNPNQLHRARYPGRA